MRRQKNYLLIGNNQIRVITSKIHKVKKGRLLLGNNPQSLTEKISENEEIIIREYERVN